MDTWEQRQAARTGAEVQRLRKAVGMTAQQLADRMDELGLRMTRQAISDLENGRRRYVTTAELSVIAAALGVPPVQLLYPELPDGDTEYLPGQHVSAIEAVLKFSEQADLTGLVAAARQLHNARSVAASTDMEGILKALELRGKKQAEAFAAAQEHTDRQRRRVEELEARLRMAPGAVVRDA